MRFYKELRKRLGKEVWCVDGYINGVRVRDSGFPTKREAEDAIASVRTRARNARYGLFSEGGPVTIAELVAERVRDLNESKKNDRRTRTVLEMFRDHFEAYKLLRSLTTADLLDYKRTRLRCSHLRANSINRELEAPASSFSSKDEAVANRLAARRFLLGAPWLAVGIPLLFYLGFGVVDSFALAFTAFMVVLCLLIAVGLYYGDQSVLHTPVIPRSRLLSSVGGFWLVACAFGPFFGWVVTTPMAPLTEDNWWWRYAVRAALSVGMPLLTALPLLVYVRGKGWFIMLLLLVGVTSLPVWSGVNTLFDLREGPVVQRATGYSNASRDSFYPNADGHLFMLTLLSHTGRAIKIEPSQPDSP
jgi:hypothetical protein